MAQHPHSENGFTLVELSIVLVIAGILVGLGGSLIAPLNQYSKVHQTKEAQEAALQSVTGWASSHNYLPDSAGFPSVASSPVDAWGRNLVYLYDPDLYAVTPTKDTICGRRATGLSVVAPSGVTVKNVAFLILSGAENAALTSSLSGLLNGGGINGAVSGSGPASGTVTLATTNPDLARWVTLDELRSRIGCQGAPLRIVNNELPVGAAPSNYSVTLSADGGVPFSSSPTTYKWCVNTLPAGLQQTGGVQSGDCTTLGEAGWGAASAGLTISFSGGGIMSGAYPITMVARDNADGTTTSPACNSADPGDNCAQKLFVLTVNPQ